MDFVYGLRCAIAHGGGHVTFEQTLDGVRFAGRDFALGEVQVLHFDGPASWRVGEGSNLLLQSVVASQSVESHIADHFNRITERLSIARHDIRAFRISDAEARNVLHLVRAVGWALFGTACASMVERGLGTPVAPGTLLAPPGPHMCQHPWRGFLFVVGELVRHVTATGPSDTSAWVAVVVSCGAPGEAPLLRRVYTCVDPDVAPVGTHVVVLLNAKRRSAEASDGIILAFRGPDDARGTLVQVPAGSTRGDLVTLQGCSPPTSSTPVPAPEATATIRKDKCNVVLKAFSVTAEGHVVASADGQQFPLVTTRGVCVVPHPCSPHATLKF